MEEEKIIVRRAQKPEITFEQFEALDIRMCLIKSVERVADTDRLYKLEIETGIDTRIVVSAIADKINPSQLENKKVPFVLNFAPIKIKGIESRGMIILSENQENGFIAIPGQDEQVVEVGAIII